MTLHRFVAPALAVCLLLTFGCEQEPATPDAAQGTQALAEEAAKHDSVHDVMEEVEKHYKYLRRQSESGESAELLARSAKIRTLTEHAKTLTPDQVQKLGEDQKQAMMQAYEQHLNKIGPILDTFDAAIAADDRAAATEAVGKLHDAEDAGHDALDVDEDH